MADPGPRGGSRQHTLLRLAAAPATVDAGVALLFGALACLWWWPLPLHVRDAQLEWPVIDPAYNEWILAWGRHALLHDPRHFFDANMFYPHPFVLAWGDNLFALTLLSIPLAAAAGTVGAHNLLVLGSTAASGFTTYLLARRVVGPRSAAVVAGVLFSFAWFRVAEWTHLQILSTQWIPLVFLAAERLRDRVTPARTALLALSVWLVLATNVYLAVFTAIAFGVFVVMLLATRRLTVRALVSCAIGWAVAGSAALPLYLPSLRYQRAIGITRSLAAQELPATLRDYLPWPPPGSVGRALAGQAAVPVSGWHALSLVAGVLAASAVVLAVARRRGPWLAVAPYAAIAALAAASSLGPAIRWHARPLVDNPVFLAEYHLVPGASVLRVPGRWSLMVAFALALVAAAAVAALSARWRRGPRVALAVVILVLIAVELVPSRFALHSSYALADFPEEQWLADQPGTDAVLQLPISADNAAYETQVIEARRMLLSTYHWKRRVSGAVSPTFPPAYPEDARLLADLPSDPAALDLLRSWHVRWVVFRAADYRAEGLDDAAARRGLDSIAGLRLVRDWGDTAIWEVDGVRPGTARTGSVSGRSP
ncbi:MAG TPA: hypothetical protein VHN98_01655 [Acidimicrobiales bacterium]|nr:hypothetical protein [Acidimicrobiales bacterium]